VAVVKGEDNAGRKTRAPGGDLEILRPDSSSQPIELKLSGSLRQFFTLQVFFRGLSRVILLVRSRHLVQYFLHRFRG
jgi:hypothetical protein